MTTLIDLFAGHGVLLVFLATFAARVGLPVPAAPVLVVAGGMAAVGAISTPLTLLVATLANLLGDAVWYEAGRRQGHRVMKLLCRVSLSPDSCVRQSESLITRWGGRSLVAAKFLPGISVVAAPMAGALGMTVRRFVAFDLLAGALWSGVFLGLGLALRDQIQRVLEILADAGLVATIALVAVVAVVIAQRAWRRQRFLRAARRVRRLAIAEVAELIERGDPPLFIDVRGPRSLSLDSRRIPGAWPVELKTLAEQAVRLPRERLLVAYCNCPNEVSAAKAAQTLAALGFERVAALVGGLDGWIAAGRPVEQHDGAAAPLREPEAVGAL